jgi:hypothetical protein
LCRQQAEVMQNHENEQVSGIGQGEARHRRYKRHKLGCGQAYDPWSHASCSCSIRYVREAWSALWSLYWQRACI